MPGRSHFNLFNEDTREVFMLCIMLMCQLHRVGFIIVVRLFCLLFDFSRSSFVRLLFHLILCFFIVIVSLFKERRLRSDPGSYSRDFDPAVPLYKNYHRHLCKSINTIHQTAPTLS
jgi:hypothetical protein